MKTFLLNHWRDVAIGILAIFCFISMKTCSSKQDNVNALTSSLDSAYTKISTYQKKNGALTYQVKTQQLTIDQIKEFGNQLGIDKKKLEDQVGNLKNLVSVLEVKVKSAGEVVSVGRDTIIVTVSGKDTTRTKEVAFNYTGKNLTLYQLWTPGNDNLRTYYEYSADFESVSYWKGRNFFKRGEVVNDITFSDTNMKVQKFTNLQVKQPEVKWYETGIAKVLGGVLIGRLLPR